MLLADTNIHVFPAFPLSHDDLPFTATIDWPMVSSEPYTLACQRRCLTTSGLRQATCISRVKQNDPLLSTLDVARASLVCFPWWDERYITTKKTAAGASYVYIDASPGPDLSAADWLYFMRYPAAYECIPMSLFSNLPMLNISGLVNPWPMGSLVLPGIVGRVSHSVRDMSYNRVEVEFQFTEVVRV